MISGNVTKQYTDAGLKYYTLTENLLCPYIYLSKTDLFNIRNKLPKPLVVYSSINEDGTPCGVILKGTEFALVDIRKWDSTQHYIERKALKGCNWKFETVIIENTPNHSKRWLLDQIGTHILTYRATEEEVKAFLGFIQGKTCVVIKGYSDGVEVFCDFSVVANNELCGIFCDWNEDFSKLSPGLLACCCAAREASRLGMLYNAGAVSIDLEDSKPNPYRYKRKVATDFLPMRGLLVGDESILLDEDLSEDFDVSTINITKV